MNQSAKETSPMILTYKKEEYQQSQLSHGGPQRSSQNLQTFRMPGELEYSEHSHQPYHSQDSQRHGLVARLGTRHRRLGRGNHVIVLRHHRGQRQEVRNDGHHVYHVHSVSAEAHLARTGGKAHQQLEREPYDTDGLDQEEGIGHRRHLVLLHYSVVGGAVYFVMFELW